MSDTNLSSFIWSIAELLRNDYKQSEYVTVMITRMVDEIANEGAG